MGQMGEGGMLSQMEMMQMEQMAAQAMLAQTQAQMESMCQNPGSGLASLRQGGGSGNSPNAGVGTSHATGDETQQIEVDRRAQRTPTQLGQGPIVAERLVYGNLVRGESVAQFSQAVQAASTGVAEAIEDNVVPIEWQESPSLLRPPPEAGRGGASARPSPSRPSPSRPSPRAGTEFFRPVHRL